MARDYGLELLKKVIIRRVGNGANTRVWRDPWIRRNYSMRPITPQGGCRLRWVIDFLEPDGTWNMTIVHRYFMEADVGEIVKIKPSKSMQWRRLPRVAPGEARILYSQ